MSEKKFIVNKKIQEINIPGIRKYKGGDILPAIVIVKMQKSKSLNSTYDEKLKKRVENEISIFDKLINDKVIIPYVEEKESIIVDEINEKETIETSKGNKK